MGQADCGPQHRWYSLLGHGWAQRREGLGVELVVGWFGSEGRLQGLLHFIIALATALAAGSALAAIAALATLAAVIAALAAAFAATAATAATIAIAAALTALAALTAALTAAATRFAVRAQLDRTP